MTPAQQLGRNSSTCFWSRIKDFVRSIRMDRTHRQVWNILWCQLQDWQWLQCKDMWNNWPIHLPISKLLNDRQIAWWKNTFDMLSLHNKRFDIIRNCFIANKPTYLTVMKPTVDSSDDDQLRPPKKKKRNDQNKNDSHLGAIVPKVDALRSVKARALTSSSMMTSSRKIMTSGSENARHKTNDSQGRDQMTVVYTGWHQMVKYTTNYICTKTHAPPNLSLFNSQSWNTTTNWQPLILSCNQFHQNWCLPQYQQTTDEQCAEIKESDEQCPLTKTGSRTERIDQSKNRSNTNRWDRCYCCFTTMCNFKCWWVATPVAANTRKQPW